MRVLGKVRRRMSEYEANIRAVREKTARLRALRLAKEASAKIAGIMNAFNLLHCQRLVLVKSTGSRRDQEYFLQSRSRCFFFSSLRRLPTSPNRPRNARLEKRTLSAISTNLRLYCCHRADVVRYG